MYGSRSVIWTSSTPSTGRSATACSGPSCSARTSTRSWGPWSTAGSPWPRLSAVVTSPLPAHRRGADAAHPAAPPAGRPGRPPRAAEPKPLPAVPGPIQGGRCRRRGSRTRRMGPRRVRRSSLHPPSLGSTTAPDRAVVDSRGGRDDPCRALVRPHVAFHGKQSSGVAKRESGATPELPRSGKWERTPSPRRRRAPRSSTEPDSLGKRRPLGTRRGHRPHRRPRARRPASAHLMVDRHQLDRGAGASGGPWAGARSPPHGAGTAVRRVAGRLHPVRSMTDASREGAQ